jgi:ubiquinone/menaquinone biosynthesis C-methylase UbiE
MSAPLASSDPSHPHHVPQPTYDLFYETFAPIWRWALRDRETRQLLIERLAIGPGHHVLDVGCGRGETTVMVKVHEPNAHVYGIDPSPQRLARAIGRAQHAGYRVQFYRGPSTLLPFRSTSIDRVISIFRMHTLTRAQKLVVMREAHRLLYREGSIHILDFGPQHTRWGNALARIYNRKGHADDNLNGGMLRLLHHAGFVDPAEIARVPTAAGNLCVWEAFRS